MYVCTQAHKSHRSQCCGVKPIDTHSKSVAVMAQYYMYVSSVGAKSAETSIVVHMKWVGTEQPPVSVAASFSMEGFERSHHWLGATSCSRAATNWLCWRYMKTQAQHKRRMLRINAKMLLSTLSKHFMCTTYIFVEKMTITSKFEMWKLKIKIEHQWLVFSYIIKVLDG